MCGHINYSNHLQVKPPPSSPSPPFALCTLWPSALSVAPCCGGGTRTKGDLLSPSAQNPPPSSPHVTRGRTEGLSLRDKPSVSSSASETWSSFLRLQNQAQCCSLHYCVCSKWQPAPLHTHTIKRVCVFIRPDCNPNRPPGSAPACH